MKKASITILSIFTIFIVWILLDLIVDNSLLLPRPQDVLQALGRIITDKDAIFAIFLSLIRLLISLIVAFIFGFGFGIISGLKSSFASYLNPIVTVLRTIPVISITVIVLIVLGFSLTPYLITFLMLFPLIYQGVFGAIKNIDQELIDVYRLEDNHIFTQITHCYIPLISTGIRTSLLQSLGLGIKVLVMAEYLAQTKNSIGNYLYLAKTNIEFANVFAWTLILIIIALIFEMLINHYKNVKIKVKVSKNIN
jgi:NitT/TauT family transport system permease protein